MNADDTRADRIARVETGLWEAYYNREWLREFRLLIAMHREFFGMGAIAADLAERELHYWIVHREVARRRLAEVEAGRPVDDPEPAEIAPVIDAFAALHAGLFNSTPEAMHESAVHRARATAVVDRISGRYSPDVAADWARVEMLLQQAYRAIETAAKGVAA